MLIVGADPEGSVYTEDAQTIPLGPYLVEGIGKDTWPKTMSPEVVDEWVRVSDRDSFLTARRLAREEGLLVGGSCGSTAWAALQVAARFGPEARVLMLLPDGGRSYLSKFYDDNWMIQYGFMERTSPTPTVDEVLRFKRGEETDLPDLVTIESTKKVGAAIELMQRYGISQLPVVRHGTAESLTDIVGSIQERSLLDRVFKNPDALNEDIAVAMQPPLAAVDVRASLDEVFADLSGPSAAVVVGIAGRPAAILTRSDLLEFLAHRRTHVDLDVERAYFARTGGADRGGSATATHLRPARGSRSGSSRRRRRSRSGPRPPSSRRASRRGRATPSAIATSGLTYWCVTTWEIGALRSSQA